MPDYTKVDDGDPVRVYFPPALNGVAGTYTNVKKKGTITYLVFKLETGEKIEIELLRAEAAPEKKTQKKKIAPPPQQLEDDDDDDDEVSTLPALS